MSSNLFDLTGRVAGSGAAQGLGRAMALALAEAGADLLLADRNTAGVQQTAEQIAGLGRQAVPVTCDVSEPAQIRALFAQLDREFGRIDFLGNVAGEGVLGRPEEISLEEVEQTWRNLVFGRFCCCQEAGRRMLAAGRGSIVNIGSLASITALGRGHIAYSMAMGGGGADDARAEHRVERPRRARQRHPAGAGGQPGPRSSAWPPTRPCRTSSSAASRAGRLGQPTTSRGWPCSWPRMRRRGSPAR